jgi:hypothetical protein
MKRPGALLARRTRTIRMCAFDARRKGQPWPLLLKGVYRGNGAHSRRPSRPPRYEKQEIVQKKMQLLSNIV